MPAEQSLYLDAVGRPGLLMPCEAPCIVEVDAARAADGHDMIVLGVTVDEILCLGKIRLIQFLRPRHADLLVNGDNCAERSVFFRILKDSDDLGDADAVVSAEARSLRTDKLLRPHHFDGIVDGIIQNAGCGDTDHIHVPLQDRQRRMFLPRRRRQIGDDIIVRILRDRTSEIAEPFLQIITDGALMSRRARNMRQCLKFCDHGFH